MKIKKTQEIHKTHKKIDGNKIRSKNQRKSIKLIRKIDESQKKQRKSIKLIRKPMKINENQKIIRNP